MNNEEEIKLSRVLSLALAQLNEMSRTLNDRREDLREANKAVWAETPIIRNMDDAMNLITISSEIAQHERQYAQAGIKIVQLKNLLNSPYFARIDFKEDGEPSLDEIYIGKHSLFDGTNFEVYDWRAPISSLYYDYGVGPASFDANNNTITGEISLKRQYRIVDGKLVYMFDSELTIEDEILQFELARTTDAKIKTIIHTIQRDQNKIIRSSEDQLLVFGPAGSGKTSVGLHRLAFLLYKYRESLTSAKVRIFSPSGVFASYIEGVIPELGEEDVLTLDFPTLIKGYGHYDPYEQIDFLQTAPDNDPRRLWISEKLSKPFVDFLEKIVKEYSPNLDDDITFNRDVICHRERIRELYRDRTTASNLSGKTSRVIEFVSRAHEEYYAANKKEITKFFNSIKDENLSDGAVRHRFDEQKNIVLADLRNRLHPRAKRIYERSLRLWAKRNKIKHINYPLNALRYEKFLYEDALALYYLDLLMGRVPKDNQAKHILLDEAQDINYLQHRILQQLYDCNFTVLADVNQALYPEIHLHSEADLVGLYLAAKVMPLTTSYRSSYEIGKFAADILGKENPNLYNRHGDEPQIIETKNPATTAAELIKNLPDTFNTVGILLPDIRSAEEFYNQISKLTSVNLLSNSTDSFGPGTMVMSVPFAKGLEFDAVICPGYDKMKEMEPKLLYLVCTRALHQLYLLSGGDI